MSRLRDLLEAVVAAREDDAPRRLYADALLEAGEPQGEFIHLQCDLAAGGLPRDEAIRRRRRERELLDAHSLRWASGLNGLVGDFRFARGFVDEVAIDAEQWAIHGRTLFDKAPALRAIRLTGAWANAPEVGGPRQAEALVQDRIKRALASPHLRRLSGLGLYPVGYTQESPFPMNETVSDRDESVSLGEQGVQLLLEGDIAHLRALALTSPGRAGVRALAASPIVAGLERLQLYSPYDFKPEVPVSVLAALDPSRVRSLVLDDWSPSLARLPEVRELAILHGTRACFVPPGLARLSYHCKNTRMTSADVEAVTACTQLVELELIWSTCAMPGWRALEHARLPNLRVLRLNSWEFAIEEARELRRWPIADQLEVLQIRDASRVDLAENDELEALFGCVVEPTRHRHWPMVYSH